MYFATPFKNNIEYFFANGKRLTSRLYKIPLNKVYAYQKQAYTFVH